MTEIQVLDIGVPAEIIQNWGWFLGFGIGLMLLGMLAIVRSVAATVVSMLFFGWLLVIFLFGVVGILIVWRPLVTAEILTLIWVALALSLRGTEIPCNQL
jgi:hypothetical protein